MFRSRKPIQEAEMSRVCDKIMVGLDCAVCLCEKDGLWCLVTSKSFFASLNTMFVQNSKLENLRVVERVLIFFFYFLSASDRDC